MDTVFYINFDDNDLLVQAIYTDLEDRPGFSSLNINEHGKTMLSTPEFAKALNKHLKKNYGHQWFVVPYRLDVEKLTKTKLEVKYPKWIRDPETTIKALLAESFQPFLGYSSQELTISKSSKEQLIKLQFKEPDTAFYVKMFLRNFTWGDNKSYLAAKWVKDEEPAVNKN